jgi:parallel beta-helix repeat protein
MEGLSSDVLHGLGGTRPRLWTVRAVLSAVALLTLAARVEGYPSYDDGQGNGCVSCHPAYFDDPSNPTPFGSLHVGHLTKFAITSCGLCHQNPAGGDVPVLTYWSADGYGCAGCHGNDYGQTSPASLPHGGQPKATAYGLRRKHALVFAVLNQPDVCSSCHFPGSAETGDPDPAPAIFPETVRPPYYGRPTNNLTDPCDSTQESFEGVPPGLDNDGNGFADMDDSACQAFVSSTTTTTVATSSTTTTTFPGTARRITVYPGQSLQDAVDALAPGGTISVMPGTYQEKHDGTNAVTISKDGVRLIARSNPKRGEKVVLQPFGNQRNGIVVEPAVANTRINGFKIKGFTIQGFPNNGIITRYLDNFQIERNEAIGNLENGIWPTLSANGLVKKNVSYGSEDSALWVEASENVRVLKNELSNSPTGLEVTVSHNIELRQNDVHDNTTGIGLYHPSAAGLPPLQPLDRNGYWDVVRNHVHDNNFPNSAPPGSMSAGLPPGGGVLVLGVDHVNLKANQMENNDFYGISVIDWCLATDCTTNPPQVADTAPDNDTFVSNTLVHNGTNPTSDPQFALFKPFAADITYLVLEPSLPNCFAKNIYSTLTYLAPNLAPTLAKSCP